MFLALRPRDPDTSLLAFNLKAPSIRIDSSAMFYKDPVQERRNFRIGLASLPKAAVQDGIKIIAGKAGLLRG